MMCTLQSYFIWPSCGPIGYTVSCLSFADYFITTNFFGKFLHVNAMKACKAGNRESYLGIEGKYVEQRKNFHHE